MNNYCLVRFLRNNHFWTQANGAEIQILSYLSQVLCTRATCFSWFYSTKIKSSFQFKSQYNRITERRLTLPIIQPFQIKGQYNGKVRPVRLVLIIPPFQFKGQYNLNISEEHFCYVTASPPCLHQYLSNSSAYIFLKCRANSLGVMSLSNSDNAVRRITLTTMSPEDSVRARLLSTCPVP